MTRKLFKQIKFNPEKMEVTYKIISLKENEIEELLDSNDRSFKVELFELRRKENELRDGTRKRWFQLLSRVLQSQKIEVNKKTLKKFSDDMKEQFFDCIEERIGESVLIIPPSLNSVPDEKVREANEKIIDIYSRLGVDFRDIV